MSPLQSISPKSNIALIFAFVMVAITAASAFSQGMDPKVALRAARDITYTGPGNEIQAIGSGQSVNSWDDRFGHGKSAALNGWGSVVALDKDGNVYVGGNFTKAGSVGNANHISYWNGENWTNVGDGLNGPVSSINVIEGVVYVGGTFTLAGAAPSSQNLAKWNGSKWESIGDGLPGLVTDVEMYNGSLYVSGWFSNAGSNGASYIARWDGKQWQPLGQGVNGWVSGMAIFDGKLIAAGLFTSASNVSGTRYIAAWDGSKWSALGNGANDLMLTVTTDGNSLYAGGAFTSVSNVAGTSYIARWDGQKWSSLGNGVDDWVSGIHVDGDNVAVGGWFRTASNGVGNSILSKRLASFSTSSGLWTSIGNGVSYPVDKEAVVLSVAQAKGNVYVAGVFNMTGSTSALGFGRWIDESVQYYETPKLVSPANHTVVYGGSASLKWGGVDGAVGYTIQVSNDPSFSTVVKSATVYTSEYTLQNVSPSVDYYWRVRSEFAYSSSYWSDSHHFVRGVATSVEDETAQPGEFKLLQNYPNPFNPSTTIAYVLGESAQVTITVHSADGRLVATLVNGTVSAGSYTASFDAKNLSSGVYLYRMQTPKNVITRTMTLIK